MTAIVLDGLVLGLQYALLALGMTLVYGLGGVLNLAHGQMAVVAAITVAKGVEAGLPAGGAALLGLMAAGLLGLLLDTTILRPVYRLRGEQRVLLSLLLTLGVAFIVDGLLAWRFPLASLGINIGGDAIPVLGVRMRTGSLLASGISIAAGIALLGFFRGTIIGRAVRSVIQDEEGARLIGVDPERMRTLILIMSGVLAGLMAITRSMTAPMTVSAGFGLTTLALIVTVVGGLGSVAGAFLAGILLGIVNTVSSFYIGSFITSVVLLTAAGLTILLRPAGLLGTPE